MFLELISENRGIGVLMWSKCCYSKKLIMAMGFGMYIAITNPK